MSPLFITPLLAGTIFIIAGIIMLKFPPKRINMIYGYRTPCSMKNQTNWDFAQMYSAKELIRMGIVFMLLSATGLLFRPNKIISSVSIIVLLTATILFLFTKVESAIKRNEHLKNR